MVLNNVGSSAVTYELSNQFQTDTLGIDVAITPSSLTIPARGRAEVRVTLSLSEAEAAALADTAPGHGPDIGVDDFGQPFQALTHVAGAIVANPQQGGVGNYNVRVPWLIAPRGLSQIDDNRKDEYSEDGNSWDTSVLVQNNGVHAGIADLYASGLQDANDGLDGIDLRAVGVQSAPTEICTGAEDADDRCLIFAVNTWNKWSNGAESEFDVLIDTDNDDELDYAVVGLDLFNLGLFAGVPGSVIIDLETGALVDAFFATAGTNGATILLPVLASELGLEQGADTNFEYYVESYEFWDAADETITYFDVATTGNTTGDSLSLYDAFNHPISNGNFEPLEPGDEVEIPLSVSKDGYRPSRGMKGWMLVSLEDAAGQTDQGKAQADLIPVGDLP